MLMNSAARPMLLFRALARRSASSQAYTDALAHLKQDLKKAMLAKDDTKKTTIRSLLATIKNKEIDSRDKPLDHFALHDIYSKLVAQRRESIDGFLKNGRDDLVQKEQLEMQLIQAYMAALPVASAEELAARADAFLHELKSTHGALPLPKVFAQVSWPTVAQDWNASPAAVRSALAAAFKKSS
ncbi:ACR100Cp [Eremothecium gossypii ATCC 10895]|uniref:Altered inheritance of mitochondria protein 41, mitochondrial n=1 Tax=Eremothecium gossypii (strain ATCC 10895 / CBS 109.51 / FGSC 9923 / NRRL Y-1056) TaxID=284811 RepID=AIM41_EREGS|nr:ACR100Cp [Eremothecium gossypii ATCC 10895]Q75C17.1 RecName: Full=Altered inheritance of mitochondria protein 41, mitochondrial; Flags: Precursor [Eremothecium gossypii ATCC 10895]AAS51326.1 ACR100Cp [Eremothecium gossypii ATCC 10895]